MDTNSTIKTGSQLQQNNDPGFEVTKTVYLAEVNIYGDVYFSRYFDWQGYAREEFVRKCLPIDFSSGIKFATKSASLEYFHSAKIFDEIAVKLYVAKIKRASLEIKFVISNKNTKLLLAEGCQVIVFIGLNGKVMPVPEPIKRVATNYLELTR